MKQRFTLWPKLLPLALALGVAFTARAQTTYSQVPLTPASFTADVVANGAAASPPTASTTADVDGGGFYLISQDYYTATTAHTSGLPNNGAIANTIVGPSALTYQLASLSANNSLRLAGATSGTVTLVTPTAASEVYVLGLSGSGTSTVTVTVTYADGTTTTFADQTYPDWFTFDPDRNVFGASGRGSVANPVTVTTSSNSAPFLSQLKLTLPGNKVSTNITSLTFNKTSTGGYLNIMAVSKGVAPFCTAPPANLTTVASTTAAGGTALTTACTGTSIYLSVSGVPTTSSGYTYQWQASTTSATAGFANISGATGSTYTATGQTATTYYRVLVGCYLATGSTPTASAPVQVTQNPVTSCYCTPSYTSGGASDAVTRVRLGTLDNSSGNPAAPHYTDYTGQQTGTGATLAIPTLTPGGTATVTLNFGSDANQYSAVWIDFNLNGVFDASEFFSTGTNAGGNGTANIPITVPAAAVLGNVRMRIRGGDDNPLTSGQSCGASNSPYGEGEDYLVNIAAACTPSSATFSYGSTSSYCVSGATNPAVTLASGATAGTFTSTTGLTLNATTGAITLSSSTPGTYTVTNTVAATSTSCASTATTTVTITAAPRANFSYAAGSYCASGTTNPTVTLAAGSTAGTFSSTTGLTINSTTGVITLSSSTPGTYTVTNTVAAANGCAAVSSTATVTITTAQTAGFSYGGGPFCVSGATNPTVTLASGAAAGTFSSTAGLTLNATTGAITLSSSTPGTYTVTNTVAASGSCAAASSTATITIAAAPSAAFSYATPATGAACAGGAGTFTPVLAAGSSAGTFSSTTGLTINASTGVISLSSSTGGTYTITNTVAAAGGCAAVSSTATFTVNGVPGAPTITASGSPATGITLTSSVPGGNQWFLNGQPVTGATGVTYFVNSGSRNGTYTVTVTTAAGCSSAASAPVTVAVTGTAAAQAAATLTLVPNPTPDGQLRVTLGGFQQALTLTVLNALGQRVREVPVPAAALAQLQLLDLSALPAGVYLLHARTADGRLATQRLVRE